LLYQACREQYGVQAASLPGGHRKQPAVHMPLAIVRPGTMDWYYACSWAQPQPWWLAESCDHWNKRVDIGFAELLDHHGRILIEKGRYKAYHMPLFYYVASRIEWYCVGDRAIIERLLSTVTHIGKKQAQGWGRAARWTVEPWPEDWSVWRDGQLIRGVPLSDVPERKEALLYGIRPGYYARHNQMMVVMPDV